MAKGVRHLCRNPEQLERLGLERRKGLANSRVGELREFLFRKTEPLRRFAQKKYAFD